MKKTVCLSVLVFSSLFADSDIEILKKQVEQQSKTMHSLEKKVAFLEQKEKQSVNTSASFSQNAYLPDIALILNMSALNRDVKNSEYEQAAIPGFIDKGEMHLPFNKDTGFNLNYAEVAMHSVVDPYFEPPLERAVEICTRPTSPKELPKNMFVSRDFMFISYLRRGGHKASCHLVMLSQLTHRFWS